MKLETLEIIIEELAHNLSLERWKNENNNITIKELEDKIKELEMTIRELRRSVGGKDGAV